ncbi:MAG: hypothetical protein JWQ35_1555 [Bacteriovoracaceae bacterium]|nr:hypothetical protein [Bacteriovoracaceae bacterium]
MTLLLNLTLSIFIFLFLQSPLSAESLTSNSKFEFTPAVAFYNGDALRAMTLGSGSLTYHLNKSFWFGGDFMSGAVAVDSDNGVGLKSSDLFSAADGAFYWNLPALLGGDLPADLYTSIGLGALWTGHHKEMYGFIGGGLTIHTPLHWLMARFDLKNLFFMLPNSKGGDFNSDMVLSMGPSLFF